MAQEFNAEYVVLRQALMNKLGYIIELKDVLLHRGHASFELPRYEMDLRTYLRNHRDQRKLNVILSYIAQGIKELHTLGYAHRDLKPENIVLNLRPIEARLIDFQRSLPYNASTKGSIRGTPGYYPEA